MITGLIVFSAVANLVTVLYVLAIAGHIREERQR